MVASTTERSAAPPAEALTIARYRGFLRNHIGPKIGAEDARTFGVNEARKFRDDLLRAFLAKGNARVTADSVLALCRFAFNYHNPDCEIGANPFRSVRIKVDKRSQDDTDGALAVELKDIHSAEEVEAILAQLTDLQEDKGTATHNAYTNRQWQKAEVYIMLGYYCGLRASEIRGLRRDRVDLVNDEIRIDQRADGQHKIGKVKSAQGYRDVPVPPILRDKLKALLWTHNFDLVIPTRTGHNMSHSNFLKRFWKPVQERAEVKQVDFHATRHFYASRLIEMNLNPKLVSTLMGHHSFAFTEKVYGKLIQRRQTAEDRKRIAAAIVGEAA